MARVTVEDCIDKVENRFELVLLASHRARLISSGAPLTIDRDHDKNPVVALREIADETIAPDDSRSSSSIPCRNTSRSMSLRPRRFRCSADGRCRPDGAATTATPRSPSTA